ncbi:phosphoribosylformylglycinamidine cyclo-ligase [Gleimia sp. 6138-11-ORH1]|uniref:phosphoribosylformylglycinamidine cyclo-ligase n=1 Tax=Gleimia sp. 6138-11-ORH1 TaxID=2973937 RepID=UPI002166F6C7|nr:phosphoribosylformylglycinamidine cyclo-ligase [Gleimia sp. 6138-11-ORH1]MCS4484700.1 phosphoribosylformylglycinamidine cyclo-ligase [Gleimia sp. 6138-11-ORH1]
MVDYAEAGVDIAAGDQAVELMKSAVNASHNATVRAGAGGFAGLIDASALKDMKKPLLASSTDGVGTKVAIAQALDIHHTIGQDLVGMVVDDLVVMGARPLLMTDYIATGKVFPEKIADIVRGIATACAAVDCPLIGGETAEHPGLMAPDEYDIAGAATGVVDEPKLLGAHRVQAGDILIAMGASGLHSNGYSLVRRIIADSGWKWEREVAEFGRTLGEEVLEPTRLYTRECLTIIDQHQSGVHALSHITGGGLGANISRVIPAGLTAIIERDSWTVPPVFNLMRQLGEVPWPALEETLNLGVGMVVVVAAEDADSVLKTLAQLNMPAWELGRVVTAEIAGGITGRLVQGAKGVNGGGALLVGEYQY